MFINQIRPCLQYLLVISRGISLQLRRAFSSVLFLVVSIIRNSRVFTKSSGKGHDEHPFLPFQASFLLVDIVIFSRIARPSPLTRRLRQLYEL
jgi:hypothetical protein